VGKSTILKKIGELYDVTIINTGNFFSAQKSSDESKSELIDHIIRNQPAIIDTHYAGHCDNIYSGKFERGLYNAELERLNKNVDLEMILIDLDEKTHLNRILTDKQNLRDSNGEHTYQELLQNRKYFQEYCLQLGKVGTIIFNYDADKTMDILKQIIDLNNNLYNDSYKKLDIRSPLFNKNKSNKSLSSLSDN